MKLTVVGAGAWGTALAISLAARHEVTLWVRDSGQYASMVDERVNRRYLNDFVLPDSVSLSNDLAKALEASELALLAVPMAGLRSTLEFIAKNCKPIPAIWTCKGFESGSAKLPHEVAAEEFAGFAPYGVLSGPSFAREVAQGLPIALTLASSDSDFASSLAAQLHFPRLRIYSSTDIVGVEVGGAVKNVMAIASGISDGLGLGCNARAALITRGLAEITRLGLALGGRMETFLGLSGVGDLTLTCTGDLSRNRRVGMMLAKGLSLPETLRQLGSTAEGVYTAREVADLAGKLKVDMPITCAICKVLYQDVPAGQAVEELLARDPKAENNLG